MEVSKLGKKQYWIARLKIVVIGKLEIRYIVGKCFPEYKSILQRVASLKDLNFMANSPSDCCVGNQLHKQYR